jgi:hypothetical protein
MRTRELAISRSIFFATLPYTVVGSLLLLLAGCGGGSGGASTGPPGAGDGSPTVVTFKFTSGTPSVIAARVGSGAFTAQTLSAGALSLSIPSGASNFAVAFVCILTLNAQAQIPEQFVFEASTADGSTFTLPCPAPLPSGQTGTLTGSVDLSGIPGATAVNIVATNGAYTTVSGAPLNGAFALAEPTGTDRVLVLAYGQSQQSSPSSLLAARNLPNQTVPGTLNAGTPVVLGPADETSPQAITYNNVPPGYASPSTVVGFILGNAGGFTVAGSATTQYPTLPAAAVQSGDYYKFLASASSLSTRGEEVLVLTNSASGNPVSFTFPAPWSYAGPTPAALPSFNFAYTGFPDKTGVMESAAVGWTPATGISVFSEVNATANYQNGSTTLAFPDLSGLAGFLPAPTTGSAVAWTAEILHASAGATLVMPSNTTGSAVANSGSFTVP